MKLIFLQQVVSFLAISTMGAMATVRYVDANSTNPMSPFTDWTTAATNIQDAIDASGDGDQILVTNGVYRTGGRVMAGNLTNRVALDRAVTVQSVNGPWATIIQGAGATNGPAAVRCAWLTNNAALIGFTLKWGATRTSGETRGGGVWCAASNAVVANCVIISNTAYGYGGGAYQGTLKNCLISSNSASTVGGGSCNAALNSCTVISNANVGVYQIAPNVVRATNCIIYFNASGNFGGGTLTFSHCCTTPAVAGSGNFTNDPQLFVDGIHLTSTSPCIGAGTNVVTGTDIFGNAWSNPPSIGCAEWQPAPTVTPPQIQLTGDPVGFTVGNAAIAGQPQFTCSWLKDGVLLQDNGHFRFTQTTNLVATGVSFADAGSYQLVVSNASGVVTSAVAQLVVHCVDATGTNPIAPYSTWATAATNIQDAITASVAGDIVLVTNGLYAVGGKSMDGAITNRVSVDKAIIVQSVNGLGMTVIQGTWDPTSTNGLGAVRCAWLTNRAVLGGFTLSRGATRAIDASFRPQQVGGGVWGVSNSIVANCTIENNAAASAGGGAFGTTLINCLLLNNSVLGVPGFGGKAEGGGVYNCNLTNCVVTGNYALGAGGGTAYSSLETCAVTRNSAKDYAGGVYYGNLVNCTVTENSVLSATYHYGGGARSAALANCIVYGNQEGYAWSGTSNYYDCAFSFSCSSPLPGGEGNISADPQLLADGTHVAPTSPCIGAGTAGVVFGTDIDGQAWNTPPSIGCDEWHPAPVIGVQPTFQVNSRAHGLTFKVMAAGQTPFTYFWNKDGALIQDDGHYTDSGTANLVVNSFGPEDAGLYQVVVSNAFGVVTSQVAQVVIHAVDVGGGDPVAPYSTWVTAATNIQDAIDIAAAGDIVLVTNGVYKTGGKAMAGDLTNRIALDKPVTVTSVNAYAVTVIQGAWDPASTNGPGAMRCAYLTDGAVLSGFTLHNGATRATGSTTTLQSGGGVWCASTNGVVSNCLLTNNSAIYGGGISYGTLNNSLVVFNLATYGGGAYYATLNNCTVVNNYTTTSFSNRGAGTYGGFTRNSIVVHNYDNYPFVVGLDNYPGFGSPQARYDYSCTSPSAGGYPMPSGVSNINAFDADPQFLDWFHIAATSPCRGAGSALYANGTDLDGEPWASPPSMGCDEVIIANLVGSLSVSIRASQTNLLVNRYDLFTGSITGRASRVEWSFGDGPAITNYGLNILHKWTNSGDYTATFTAFNNDNPDGVSANLGIHVAPLLAPQLQSVGVQSNNFVFQFAGQSEANYTVQYATNLSPPVTWQVLQSIYNSASGLLQITDSSVTNGARFYRVLVQ